MPDKIMLTAGDLNCVYESGMIRYVSVGDGELIRCIYAAVRDRNWGTIVPVITNEKISAKERSFSITCHAEYRAGDIQFEADYFISGGIDNRIIMRMEGHALSTFLKNRIGYCILHPLNGITGKACRVTHPEGITEQAIFPDKVSPHPPMTNIASLEWENGSVKCRLSLEGDTWEMEDQRNWTDSSFKTYCTPLSLPFPVTITAGSKVKQTVRLEVFPNELSDVPKADHIRFIMSKPGRKLPYLGTCIPEGKACTPAETSILEKTGLHHLRFDLKFSNRKWMPELERAVLMANAIDARLELVIHFSQGIEEDILKLPVIADICHSLIWRIWAVHETTRMTDDRLIELAFPFLKKIFPHAAIGAGTDAYFAEFNRNRFDNGSIDFVTFAVSPQVHAFDQSSLVENIEAQSDVIESAQALYPGKKVQVSPVTLRQRFNVVATGEEPPVPEDMLPYHVDERQMSMFAAGWTLGSFASLAQGGADAVTYYEVTGWRGLIQGDEDPEKPDLFAGRRGEIFPVFHVLRLLCSREDARFIPCRTLPELNCSALAIQHSHHMLLVVANHTNLYLTLLLEDFSNGEIACWNSTNLEQSYHDAEFLDHMQFHKIPDSPLMMEPFSFYFLKKSL